MTLLDLLKRNRGSYTLYWYSANGAISAEACTPYMNEENQVVLLDHSISEMDRQNLFCLVYEDAQEDNVYVYNKGYISNLDRVILHSDDYTINPNEKRLFHRFEVDFTVRLLSASKHIPVEVNNISYNGINISSDIPLSIGEDVMLYQQTEYDPVYVYGKVVYFDGKHSYGIQLMDNFQEVNRLVIHNTKFEN